MHQSDTIPHYLFPVRKKYPATSQLAHLALIDMTYLKSVFLCLSTTVLRSWAVLPLATTIFQSGKEEQREPTEMTEISAFSNILHWKVEGDV